MNYEKMQRATKQTPCPVCGKPDWCGVTRNGAFAVCMRVSEGAIKATRNGGYLHILLDKVERSWQPRVRVLERFNPLNRQFDKLASRYTAEADIALVTRLSRTLGISELSLVRLGIGWAQEHRAWSFPMSEEHGVVRGIRLRSWHGGKWSVKGGRNGLFIPTELGHVDQLLVAEGPTDTAALLDLDFAAVGRPSARGGEDLLVRLIRRVKPESVIVVADTDPVGIEGAEQFAHEARLFARQVKIITPPPNIKDVRAWKQMGATRKDILAAIESAPLWGIIIGNSD